MISDENSEILKLLKELEGTHYPAGPIYQRICSCRALMNEKDDELETIYHLAETHSPGLRARTVLRYEKLLANESKSFQNITNLQKCRDNLAFKCSTYSNDERINVMLKQLKEMPKEWTIVQMTPRYNSRDILNEDNNVYYTNSIHISVFSCGQDEQPFLVTVAPPKDPVTGHDIELIQEMNSIVKSNVEVLTNNKKKVFRNPKEKMHYIDRRQAVEDRLRNLIKVMQDMWLKELRCLLIGKYCDEKLEEKIKAEITTYFKTEVTDLEVTKKILYILCSAVKSYLYLKLTEVKKIVQFCFPDSKDNNTLIRNIVQFIRSLGNKVMANGADTKKYPVILVLHDALDCFPWEMIDVLQEESVTRLPSLHFVYCLFKEHENDIVDGHKVITCYDKGAYIVNPDMDLRSMETRMMNFLNYWTPSWTGTSGYQPSKEEFFELLTSSDIFSYNGHGSGSHLMSMDKLQKTHVKAVVLLFGCGSTKIVRMDPQVEMFGYCHTYLIARCPCVVGMLWEVTDVDTDTLTTDFLSYWIPSKAPVHWKHVDKTKWKKAEEKIEFTRNTTVLEGDKLWEPELLKALIMAKKGLSFNMTKAACVVRGLPVKIKLK
ncbi:hypothetical protein JTB14_011816 [Gonioctena quinquepunctata]|nr:hypothetical protein JTB14_011816 [Gonioctena quinquepunctata]